MKKSCEKNIVSCKSLTSDILFRCRYYYSWLVSPLRMYNFESAYKESIRVQNLSGHK